MAEIALVIYMYQNTCKVWSDIALLSILKSMKATC
jgi:hypothetical protein